MHGPSGEGPPAWGVGVSGALRHPRTRQTIIGWTLIGLGYGWFASHLPAPSDPRDFWIGNLCAPWVALPFVAGSRPRGLAVAMAAGVTVGVACVFGFYASGITVDPLSYEMGSSTPWWKVVPYSFVHQYTLEVRWFSAAVVAGVVMGSIGWRWRRSGSPRWILVLAAAMAAEPLCWMASEGFLPEPHSLWVVEVGAGVALAAVVVRRRRPEPAVE